MAPWGTPAYTFGEGGSISFMAMLGELPDAQFAILGVLGPGSNAHGPNEFLHLPTGRKLTAVIARLLGDHADSRPVVRSQTAFDGDAAVLLGLYQCVVVTLVLVGVVLGELGQRPIEGVAAAKVGGDSDAVA